MMALKNKIVVTTALLCFQPLSRTWSEYALKLELFNFSHRINFVAFFPQP